MAHYYSEEQESPLRPKDISFNIRDRLFTVTTGSGVFSKDSLDNATKLLIEKTELVGDEKVLDLGCGWGAVGLVLKSVYPNISLVVSDVNKRALMLARKNLRSFDVTFVKSDVCQNIKESFDLILTNPPYAAGRAVCFAFIEQAFENLLPKGKFLLVARHQKGGKVLEQHIEKIFGNVSVLGKQGGFRVYQGVKD